MDEPLSPEELEAALAEFETEGAEFLGPSEFARHMQMKPQLVHYYIRTGVLEAETCKCGRKVIDVAKGTEALGSHKTEKATNIRRDADPGTSE